MRTKAITAALALASTGTALISPQAHAQSMMDQIIYSKCSSAMEADYKQAGKVPPAGLVDKMCKCVVKEIGILHSIEGAKNVCVAEFAPANSNN